MNERRKQMAQEPTGKAIPYEQWKKKHTAYKKRLQQKKMEQNVKAPQGSGELRTTEADERALDKAWDKVANSIPVMRENGV